MRRAVTMVLIAVVAACTSIAGCGQKGPLYLPDKKGTVVTRPGKTEGGGETPAETPAEAQEEDQTPR